MKKLVMVMLTILFTVAILCAVAIGVYLYVIKKPTSPAKSKPLTAAQAAALQVAFPQMICNLQDDLVQFTITVQADNSSTKAEITAMMPEIEDKVNYMTREFTAEEVRQPSGFIKLKTDMLSAINSELTSGKATQVYVSQIVVQ